MKFKNKLLHFIDSLIVLNNEDSMEWTPGDNIEESRFSTNTGVAEVALYRQHPVGKGYSYVFVIIPVNSSGKQFTVIADDPNSDLYQSLSNLSNSIFNKYYPSRLSEFMREGNIENLLSEELIQETRKFSF